MNWPPLQEFLTELGNPAYRHLLVNHLPIIGLAASALTLLFALFVRGHAARVPALLAVLLMSLSALLAYETGEQAYKPIHRIADDAGSDWLDLHMDRADQGMPAYYALASLALIALTFPIKWPRLSIPLAALTVAGAMACTGVGGWIAQSGGPIRHAELRPAAPEEEENSLPTP